MIRSIRDLRDSRQQDQNGSGEMPRQLNAGQFVGLRPDVFKIAESTSPLWTLRTSSDRAAGKWRPKQALNPRFIIRLFRGVISDRFESTVNLLHLMLAKAAETLFYCRNR